MHELGGMVMHRFPTETMEKQANEFTAEFLMPASQIRPQLHSITRSETCEP
jgi:Zn-dependent peptidase ImmA (M78 family)